ncbi:MAG: hypothetical protein GY823_09220 [Flavobacteriaceae bacterium]|nr:hypothetical protein [Flavobacteriaceae bacterium]
MKTEEIKMFISFIFILALLNDPYAKNIFMNFEKIFNYNLDSVCKQTKL